MQRARRYRFVGVALGVGLAGFIALSACSNNGEGERCETLSANSGKDDCQDGLMCLAAAQANEGYRTSDRCCPLDRTTATHPACALRTAFDSSVPPAETGPIPDATSTADAAETSPPLEAGVDTGADASDGD